MLIKDEKCIGLYAFGDEATRSNLGLSEGRSLSLKSLFDVQASSQPVKKIMKMVYTCKMYREVEVAVCLLHGVHL